MLLPLQDIRDLLPTALVLTGAPHPNQALDCGRELASLSGAVLGLGIGRQQPREPVGRTALQPLPRWVPGVGPDARQWSCGSALVLRTHRRG